MALRIERVLAPTWECGRAWCHRPRWGAWPPIGATKLSA